MGIPARVISGLIKLDQGAFTSGEFWKHTLTTHVWSEIYIPAYGWIQDETAQGPLKFASINALRIVLSKGEDIVLGHDFPIKTVPWFHIPQTDVIGESDPQTQNPGDSLSLTIIEKQ